MRLSLIASLMFVLSTSVCFGVTIGQIDTFENGTTENWIVGLLGMASPVPPVNISTGGPAGVEDNFLRLTSIGGAAAGSRLAAINVAQWAGDYLTAGISAITADVRNPGSTDLFLRLLFENAQGGPPTDVAASTNAILLPAGSDWTSVVFPIYPSALSALAGDVETVLANTTVLRIYSSEALTFPPAASVSQLDVDNLNAVPEPSTVALIGIGLATLVLRRRRSSL